MGSFDVNFQSYVVWLPEHDAIAMMSQHQIWYGVLSIYSYIEMGYRVRRMGTFGCCSSTLMGGVCGQRLELFFCIGSIGVCPENRILSP